VQNGRVTKQDFVARFNEYYTRKDALFDQFLRSKARGQTQAPVLESMEDKLAPDMEVLEFQRVSRPKSLKVLSFLFKDKNADKIEFTAGNLEDDEPAWEARNSEGLMGYSTAVWKRMIKNPTFCMDGYRWRWTVEADDSLCDTSGWQYGRSLSPKIRTVDMDDAQWSKDVRFTVHTVRRRRWRGVAVGTCTPIEERRSSEVGGESSLAENMLPVADSGAMNVFLVYKVVQDNGQMVVDGLVQACNALEAIKNLCTWKSSTATSTVVSALLGLMAIFLLVPMKVLLWIVVVGLMQYNYGFEVMKWQCVDRVLKGMSDPEFLKSSGISDTAEKQLIAYFKNRETQLSVITANVIGLPRFVALLNQYLKSRGWKFHQVSTQDVATTCESLKEVVAFACEKEYGSQWFIPREEQLQSYGSTAFSCAVNRLLVSDWDLWQWHSHFRSEG